MSNAGEQPHRRRGAAARAARRRAALAPRPRGAHVGGRQAGPRGEVAARRPGRSRRRSGGRAPRAPRSRGGGRRRGRARRTCRRAGGCSRPSSATRRTRWGRRWPLASTPPPRARSRSSARVAGPPASALDDRAAGPRVDAVVEPERAPARGHGAVRALGPTSDEHPRHVLGGEQVQRAAPRPRPHDARLRVDVGGGHARRVRARTASRAAAASCACTPHSRRATSATPPRSRGSSPFAASRSTAPTVACASACLASPRGLTVRRAWAADRDVPAIAGSAAGVTTIPA